MKSSSLYIQQISSKLPGDSVSNREFSFLIPPDSYPEDFNPETADAWIHERSGIRTRNFVSRSLAGKREAPIEAEFELSLECLKRFAPDASRWSALDAIIVVRSTPNHYSPALSQKILHHYSSLFDEPNRGNSAKFTLDLFQPSTGLLSALKVLNHLPFQNAWVVIPEILSPYLNLKDPSSAILFGDGIAALWVTRNPASPRFRLMDIDFVSMPDTHRVLGFEQTNESFYMKGPELFRKIIPEFKKSSLKILERNQLNPSEIQYYLPHQANARIIERAASSIGFEAFQIIRNIEAVGNTASASMIIALDHFLEKQRLKTGTKILLNACGAGLSSGAAILEVIE